MSAEDRRAVVAAARLSNLDQQVLYNMTQLLDRNSYFDDHTKGSSSNNTAANPVSDAKVKSGFFSSIFGRGMREAEKIASTAEGDYTDTRHVSTMKQILEQAINGQLPLERFASIGPALPTNNESKATASSVRKFKGTDGRWGGAGGGAGGGAKHSTHLVGGRVMTFVAGGICYAEMRDGYEVMAKEGREVIVGGSHLTTPKAFIKDILQLELSK